MPRAKRKKGKAIKVNIAGNKYSKFYEKLKVKEDIVVYRCNGTPMISGAPYAVFLELIKREEYSNLIHYIVVNGTIHKEDDKVSQYDNHPRVIFIKSGSRRYYEILSMAKYIIYNNSLPTFFIKKEGQICINTWDETPFRKIGTHALTKSSTGIWNTQRNFYSCDYLISPNRYTTDIIMGAYHINGLFPGTVIEAGSIGSTLLYQADRARIIKKLEVTLGCSLEGKKVLLYTPTARKLEGKFIDNSKIINKNVAKLQQRVGNDYVILTKLEEIDYDCFRNKKNESLIVPCEVELNEVFSIADILITDYNNVFYEFLYTGKPIICFAYDREKSEIDKDTYYSLDDFPGAICTNIKQLSEAIDMIGKGDYPYYERYQEFLDSYAPYNDGLAASRVVDIIFDSKKQLKEYTYKVQTNKKRILLHIGILNQIADRELCFYILRSIDYSKYIVIVDGNEIYTYQDEFAKINSEIRIVNSRFENNKSFWEKINLKKSNLINEPRKQALFEREFLSMYGGLTFDSIIDMVGKKTIWMNVFSSLNGVEKTLMLNQSDNTLEFLEEYASYMDKITVVGADDNVKSIDKKITSMDKEDFIEKCGISPLNVLFISAFDSTNYVFVNLIKELTHRGHQCTVVVKDKDDAINNKMYVQEDIPFVEIDEFDMKLVGIVDFVFSAPLKYECYDTLYKKLNTANKFIITFASLFSSIVMGVNPDLALSIGKSKFDEFEENGLRYNQVAIGNPQYDKLVQLRARSLERDRSNIRNVIMIEQGAYPFGQVGKTQLANVLCQIARNNPSITFTVKPRYLPSEQGKQLHVLSEHLYDFIENKPDNLVLLTEPVVLEDIMQDFDAAMTTWSTAYLDAAILGLPIILIDGLESIDVFNVRRQRIQAAYDRLRHSGCVVHFEELYHNPLPFKLVDETYLSEEIYDPYNPCVPRIMELLEFLYEKLIITEKRWQTIHQLEFSKFFREFEEIPLIDVGSDEYRHRKRLLNEANKILQKFIFENRCMGQVMDISPIKKIWEYPVSDKTSKDEITEALKQLRETTEVIKEDFFAEHFELVREDRILQDYYFQWLFMNKKYHELLTYDDALICPESLYFYRAVVLYKRHQYKTGTKYMAQFFEISANKECKDLRKDMSISAYLWKGRLGKYLILYYLDRYGAYEVIQSIDSQNVIYQRDIMLYYRVKSFIRRGMHDEAVKLCDEYSQIMFKKTKTKSLKLRVKYFVGKIFYKRTERLVQTAKEKVKNK